MSYYLSNTIGLNKCLKVTGLSLDEIESIVGRFNKNSSRAGQLRGELIRLEYGYAIRHHFSKKILWKEL